MLLHARQGNFSFHVLVDSRKPDENGESRKEVWRPKKYIYRKISIHSGEIMEVSSRNQLKGTIRMLKKGPVNTEVILSLPGGTEIVAVITTYSAEKMNLKEGSPVYAVIKASEVMIGVD